MTGMETKGTKVHKGRPEEFLFVIFRVLGLGRSLLLAVQLIAGNFQAAQIAEGGDGDGFGLEEFLGDGLQVFSGNGFDFFDELVEILEVVEIHFLAGQV